MLYITWNALWKETSPSYSDEDIILLTGKKQIGAGLMTCIDNYLHVHYAILLIMELAYPCPHLNGG